ncbi:hypothetical protein ACSBR1_013491 [Camellia fascicularis]
MASSFSTATSTWPQRMCACGYGHCFVKVSRSHKNPGRAYYVCSRPVIGWCDESGRRSPDHDSGSTDVMQLQADVVHIINTLRVMKTTNKIAYKFKMKPLEHEKLMREVFTGAIATGKHHWTPGEKAVDVGEGESDSVDFPGLVPFIEPYIPVVNSPPNSPTVHLEEADPGTKRKKGGSTSGKSKKISSGASMLADSFNHLSKAVQAQKHLTVRHGTGVSQKYGIEPYDEHVVDWLAAL